jgi:ADP-ribose pyrophosphatase
MKKPALVSDKPGWRTVKEEVTLAGRNVLVTEAEVFTPSRTEKPAHWTVVHRKPAVMIAAFTPEGRVVLIREERIPIRSVIWQFPAGQVDEENSDDEEIVRATALRELQEETGYEPAAEAGIVRLGHFFSSPGFTDEHAHLFLLQGAVRSNTGPAYGEGEGITACEEFTPARLREMIISGGITDGGTLCMFAHLSARGLM